MDRHPQQIRQFGIAMVLLAIVFRLCVTGIPDRLIQWLSQSDTISFLIYLETGRIVRFSSSEEAVPAFFRESAPPRLPEPERKPSFSAEDAGGIRFSFLCSLRPDTQALLTAPLDWNLKDGEPAVLITHTHTTESYTKTGETYTETAAFRTLEESYNMLSVGDRVAELLQEQGIAVIHDRQFHDYPSYNGSYTHARMALQEILKENPTIRLVLDLHRDAAGTISNQLRTEVVVDGRTCAQLMLVMGTNASGLKHDNWEENLALALKLQVQLERTAPGITRPICLRAQRFNQDLSPGALLIEVGAAGNTHAEALLAAEYLAQAISALGEGTAAMGETKN